jgi:pimeloyl-ACP methyl ester carboxylesterase
MIRIGLLALLTFAYLSWGQSPAPQHEHFSNAQVIYDWVTDSRGEQLRTFVTRPKAAQGRLPTLFLVGWLSCDSIEYPQGETDGFGAIIWRLVEQSGYATLRMDKPGVGESQGTCGQTDFQTEVSGYQAAFDSLLKYNFIDSDRVFVVGLSNGGGTSVLVPRQHLVRGYIAASSWGRTWYEHMLENERRRLTAAGKSPGEINLAVKAFTEFYSLYLIQGMTPGQILEQHPQWKALWYDRADGQYGRPAAFYQQLQDLNLGAAWEQVAVPVLVLRGSADEIMSDSDSRAIAESVNRMHPGRARYVEIPGADHLLSAHDRLAPSVVPTMLEWLKQQAGN